MIVFNWTDAHFYWRKLHILIDLIFWIFRTWKYKFKGTNLIFELTAIEFPLLGFKLTAGLWSSLLNSKFWVMNFSFQLKTMMFSIAYQFSLYKKIKKKFEKGSENWMVRKFAYQFIIKREGSLAQRREHTIEDRTFPRFESEKSHFFAFFFYTRKKYLT